MSTADARRLVRAPGRTAADRWGGGEPADLPRWRSWRCGWAAWPTTAEVQRAAPRPVLAAPTGARSPGPSIALGSPPARHDAGLAGWADRAGVAPGPVTGAGTTFRSSSAELTCRVGWLVWRRVVPLSSTTTNAGSSTTSIFQTGLHTPAPGTPGRHLPGAVLRQPGAGHRSTQ